MDLSEELRASLAPIDLMEASLGRIWQHNKERAFVILTAWRGNLDKATNEKNLATLKKKIRADGYGFIPVDGMGQEGKDAEGKDIVAKEPSLIVVSKDDPADADGAFRKRAVAWGKAYDQYAVFYHVVRDGEPQSAVVNVASGADEVELHSFKPNEIGTFYTKLRNKRTFKYEWFGVKFSDPPQGWIHGMGREAEGEVRFDLCETIETWQAAMRRG